jgi:hypothetical protein
MVPPVPSSGITRETETAGATLAGFAVLTQISICYRMPHTLQICGKAK